MYRSHLHFSRPQLQVLLHASSASICWCWFLVSSNLDEVSDVHRHLLNLSVVKGFNILQRSLIVGRNKIDGSSFPTKSTSTTNPTRKDGQFQVVKRKTVIMYLWM